MRATIISILMLPLAGCVEVGQAGSGQMTDGTPIIAKATSTSGGMLEGFVYTISSMDGLSCSGQAPIRMDYTPTANVDLTCNNGLTGKGVITYGSSDAGIVFKLSDGRQGSATI